MAKIAALFIFCRVILLEKIKCKVMIGLAVGALAGLGSSIFGAVKARKAQRKAERQQRRILNQMNEDNESNFLRDYYDNAFDDPTSRSYLKRISEDLYDKNKAIEGSGIATGATHENIQAQKQAANRVMSDAVNNVVVNHEQQKKAAKEQYMQRKDAISQGNIGLAQQMGEMKAQNWSNLGNNLADSITGLASGYLQGGGKLFGGGKSLGSLAPGSSGSVSYPSYNMQDFMKQKLAGN